MFFPLFKEKKQSKLMTDSAKAFIQSKPKNWLCSNRNFAYVIRVSHGHVHKHPSTYSARRFVVAINLINPVK